MLKWILSELISQILALVSGAVSDYLKLRQKRKEDQRSVDDALSTPDPQTRAARIRDLLS